MRIYMFTWGPYQRQIMLRQYGEDSDSDMIDANRLKAEFARSCNLQLYFVYMTTD